MKILSIDVGIKNLAICLFDLPYLPYLPLEKVEPNINQTPLEKVNQTPLENLEKVESNKFIIKKWDIINLIEEKILKCGCIEKNKICNKLAKFEKNNLCFCLKHAKKQKYKIPISELKIPFINKQKIQKLFEIADKYNINYDKQNKPKKTELIVLINEYINNTCFTEIKNINASKVDLITIGQNIKKYFNLFFLEEEMINHILIENQISPIANRMKTIQGMIAQYFIMNNNYENIEFISASNKLKDLLPLDLPLEKVEPNLILKKVETTKYSDRKKLGVNKCLEIITNNINYNDKIEYFKKHNKKDDLADSFLQGLWFINNKLKNI
jgi:hypothetical protein